MRRRPPRSTRAATLVPETTRFRCQLVGDDGVVLGRGLGRPVLENWTETGSIVQRDGREVPVGVSAGTLRGPGNDVNGAVFVLRDVRREQELERIDRKSTRLNSSH